MSINYSRRRVLLHWVSAAIILWALVSGFYVAFNPVSASTQQWVGSLNVSLTTLFIPFFVWRACLFFGALEARGTASSFTQWLALAVHTLIYLVIGIVLVTGVLMMKNAISIFGIVHIPQPLGDPALIELANTLHTLSCAGLSVLVALHLCAVLWHEFSGRRVVRRMSFAKPAGTIQSAQR
ncbi:MULTISPECIES: cytochrome b [unclassified Pseudomonas]|uniref:cytochrome b n=1 Tax=unclassified Pseudomonas TaxID=196821 RepID=UPI002160ED4C|nr:MULTISPECIES: cytochrome b/b6 domain-containing protein [unclassified Pseudomonas]UVM61896.1 cytochrome b/b6 domain-containing protein [Pseudomonas sp. B21-010]WPN64029.1 cytochrome b/b6 domain-containing protein [Pseudomonas sp. P9_32]WPN69781.1 cytochrome b/b6 domain-containing protein [Pseudomonas sp. P9_35]